jgi:hypothetical protein
MATITTKTDIDIDIQKVLGNIGCSVDHRVPLRVEALIHEYLENAHHIIEPSYLCIIRDKKSIQGNRIVIEGPIIFRSEVVAQLLEQCEKVAVFIATIGNNLEEMVRRLTDDKLILQATVLDAIGSIAVEKLADYVHLKVDKVANAQGFFTSRRFSPGYCDWSVKQQRTLFRAMNGDSIGVRLTVGCLMFPRKSISGLIGIGSREAENYNPCQSCDKYDCIGRK